MNGFLENFVPWIFGSAVTMASVYAWWQAKAKLDQLYPAVAAGRDASMTQKFVSVYQNHIMALAALFLTLFLGTTAGKIGMYFIGKTTLASAAHATILATEGIGTTVRVGADLASTAYDAVSEFEGGVSPEEMKTLVQEKSIFNYSGSSSGSTTTIQSTQPEPQSAASGEQLVQSAEAAPVAVDAAVVQGPSAPQAPAVVRTGDTLFAIAKRVYGNGELWPALCAANPALKASGCDNITAGQQVIVPPIEHAQTVKASTVLPAAFPSAQQAAAQSPAYGPAPAQAAIVGKPSETGAWVQSSSGWGVEVVTTGR